MNKFLYTFLMLFLSMSFCFAQNNLGARLTAMGMNGAVVKDIWSLEGNPSGITDLKSTTVAINYTKYLFDNELSKQAVAGVIPHKNTYFGASFQRYGITAYNEVKVGLVLAEKFGTQFSIAIKVNYHQIKISNYGSTTGFSVDVGAMYAYNDYLSFGFAINNPSIQKYASKIIETRIPTVFQAGVAYKASDKIVVATTINKELDKTLAVGLGLEYQLINVFSLRTGLTAKPFKQYAGFGIQYKKLVMDIAIESDPHLGYTPQIALAYAF